MCMTSKKIFGIEIKNWVIIIAMAGFGYSQWTGIINQNQSSIIAQSNAIKEHIDKSEEKFEKYDEKLNEVTQQLSVLNANFSMINDNLSNGRYFGKRPRS